MIFDSWFDSYRGVIILIKIIDGVMKKGDKIKFLSNNAEYEINEVGVNTPKPKPLDSLEAGEVGYIIASIKKISEVKIGDTVTLAQGDRRDRPARVQGTAAHGVCRLLPFRGHQP